MHNIILVNPHCTVGLHKLCRLTVHFGSTSLIYILLIFHVEHIYCWHIATS